MKSPSRKLTGFTLIELLVVIAIIALLASILFPVFGRARENARRSSCQSNLKQIFLGVQQYTDDYDERLAPAEICQIAGGGLGQCADGSAALFPQILQPYLKSTQIFQCPSDTDTTSISTWANAAGFSSYIKPVHTSYLTNSYITYPSAPLASLNSPTTTVLMCDGSQQAQLGSPFVGATKKPTAWSLGDATDASSQGTNQDWAGPSIRHLDTTSVLFADGHVKSLHTGQWYYPNSPWLQASGG